VEAQKHAGIATTTLSCFSSYTVVRVHGGASTGLWRDDRL